MRNMVKSKDAPHLLNGKWYEFFIESNGTTAKITKSNLDGCSIVSNYLKFPKDFHFVDVLYDINTIPGTKSSMHMVRSRETDGCQSVILPNVGAYDYGTIYVFGHYN